jgi:ectoine hydroxylase-related dioxygenase (phytanoyl-CoA dioxygenase family)
MGAMMAIEPDRLNRGFSWRDHSGPFRFLDAEQAASFDRDGFCILRKVFAHEHVRELREEIDRFEHEYEASLAGVRRDGGTIPGQITFTPHLFPRSDIVRRFALDEVFLKVCSDLIGPNVRLYWDQAIYKKPESPVKVPWHQDPGFVFTEPQDYLTCWLPLVDVSASDGCLWAAPGEHRRGTLWHDMSPLGMVCRGEYATTAVPLEVRIGDLVVISALAPHQTGPNMSERTRKAYLLQYAADGTRILRDAKGRDCNVGADDSRRQPLILEHGLPTRQ